MRWPPKVFMVATAVSPMALRARSRVPAMVAEARGAAVVAQRRALGTQCTNYTCVDPKHD